MGKLYKNDLEYLKSELKSQNEISDRLNETLDVTREELEEVKKQNMYLKNKLDETTKKYDEHVNIF
jgi:tRNA(Phe) wybutosine-synthesizing methylase Tyw3